MSATSNRPGKNAALAIPCDFSTFKIDDALRTQLEQVGSFGCDKIWYNELRKTWTSGHVDGYRWLFAVMGQEWFFLVFSRGDAEYVTWDNSNKLSFEESWELVRDLEPEFPEFLSHTQVFECLLKGIAEFRAAKPFD
ncbi:hypothetical protein ACCT15_16195 [Rhizobium ruizarguesonis]